MSTPTNPPAKHPPPREGYQDRITVRMARDKSYYIVYHGNVPPLDGQEYVSVREYDRLIESRARFSERATEAESALSRARAEARARAFEEAAKEVDEWLDLLELDHRDIIAKEQYKDPQEAGREYRNKCNLLGAVRASILKLSAAALSVPGEEKNG